MRPNDALQHIMVGGGKKGGVAQSRDLPWRFCGGTQWRPQRTLGLRKPLGSSESAGGWFRLKGRNITQKYAMQQLQKKKRKFLWNPPKICKFLLEGTWETLLVEILNCWIVIHQLYANVSSTHLLQNKNTKHEANVVTMTKIYLGLIKWGTLFENFFQLRNDQKCTAFPWIVRILTLALTLILPQFCCTNHFC